GEPERGAAAPADGLRALGRVVGGQVHARHGGALPGQALRDAAADVGAGAGHDRNLSAESHQPRPPWRSPIRRASSAPASETSMMMQATTTASSNLRWAT